jgi:hypothetical protein
MGDAVEQILNRPCGTNGIRLMLPKAGKPAGNMWRQLVRVSDGVAVPCPGTDGQPPAEWIPWNYRQTLERPKV